MKVIRIQHKPDALEEADNYFRKVRKIHHMMNTFLANQAYSQKEERSQLESLQRVNAPDDEVTLVKEGWRIRRVLAKKGREKLEIALKKEGAKL